jgi:hypothetical protein
MLQELFEVRGTVALVTGGGSGLGRAMAEVLAACGAQVVVADRDRHRLDALAQELAPVGQVETSQVDVADRAAVDTLVDDVVARHGRIDVVFANAGIARGAGPGDPSGQLDTFDLDDWTALVDVNLYGVLHTMRAAARHMKRQRAGSIVVTASTAGLRADPLVSYSYVVAKGRRGEPDPAGCTGSGPVAGPGERHRTRTVPHRDRRRRSARPRVRRALECGGPTGPDGRAAGDPGPDPAASPPPRPVS